MSYMHCSSSNMPPLFAHSVSDRCSSLWCCAISSAPSSATEELGVSSAAQGLFPRGAYDLVEYYLKKCDAELTTKMRASEDVLREYVMISNCTRHPF